jgi:type VI secretion system protein ImpL
VYKNETEHWQLTQWPNTGQTKGASIEVTASGFKDEIPREGDFGLFRLLLAGGLKAAGPLFVATWNLNREGAPPVTVELKPSKATQPFARGFFKRMHCPSLVMYNAPAKAQP